MTACNHGFSTRTCPFLRAGFVLVHRVGLSVRISFGGNSYLAGANARAEGVTAG